ncbi:TadE family protein [Labrys wisconsinensis]|uniref:Flp pilus assembly protein TadG n=1 Tax=Labrys wisconsinensis TaxID=425677 RepID=A0ABU0JBJ1_9HYPH|nr:TadE/TadG family type IV pilus assembly protein [Labrys wisconsinensis]MDQ0471639.1 Flp pilus assembly protein TadG [Labrys wisconsinensis]
MARAGQWKCGPAIRAGREDSGTAAVEFAFVAPIFLLFMVGILFYGSYFGAVHMVQQIAADAARASVAGVTDTERASLAQARATSDIAAFSLLNPQGVTVQVSQSTGSVQVTVTYDPSYLAVWPLAKLVPAPSGLITRVSAIDAGV